MSWEDSYNLLKCLKTLQQYEYNSLLRLVSRCMIPFIQKFDWRDKGSVVQTFEDFVQRYTYYTLNDCNYCPPYCSLLLFSFLVLKASVFYQDLSSKTLMPPREGKIREFCWDRSFYVGGLFLINKLIKRIVP